MLISKIFLFLFSSRAILWWSELLFARVVKWILILGTQVNLLTYDSDGEVYGALLICVLERWGIAQLQCVLPAGSWAFETTHHVSLRRSGRRWCSIWHVFNTFTSFAQIFFNCPSLSFGCIRNVPRSYTMCLGWHFDIKVFLIWNFYFYFSVGFLLVILNNLKLTIVMTLRNYWRLLIIIVVISSPRDHLIRVH